MPSADRPEPEGWYRGTTATAYFDSLADIYGEGEYYARRREAVIEALRERLMTTGSLLDLGAGNGAFLDSFAKPARFKPLVAIDLAPRMLEQARRRVGPGPLYIRADLRDLPLRAAVVDAVFCSHVLQLVSDLPAAVTGIARVLKPGGALIATFGLGGQIRDPLLRLLKPEEYHELEATVFGRRLASQEGEDEEIQRRAFVHNGLKPEVKLVHFPVSWAGIAEWFRLRWFPVMQPPERQRTEQLLARLSDRLDRATMLELCEPLIIGEKPD